MNRSIPISNPNPNPNPKKIVSERLYSKSKSIVRLQQVILRDTIISFRYDNQKTDFYINYTMNQSKPNYKSLQHSNPKNNVSEQQYKYIIPQMNYLFKCIILMKIPTAKHISQKKYFWLTKKIIHLYCIPPPHSLECKVRRLKTERINISYKADKYLMEEYLWSMKLFLTIGRQY